jgi:GT2 family glycosyltransferase
MISVVIPSYNRRDCMSALLTDLQRQQGVDFEVIVVDDQSSDDTPGMIRERFPDVRLIVNEANAGPAVTRNKGVRAASGGIIIGFDSDVTLPDTGLLAKVRARFDELPQVDGFAFRIFKADGTTDDVERWWHPKPAESHSQKQFPTSYFSGTAYAFRRQTMESAGLFPEILYMHYEEVQLAWSVLDLGATILYDSGLTAVHHANPVSRRSQIEVFYKPRNQILLAASCLPWPHAVAYLAPRVPFQAAKALLNGHAADFLKAMRSAADLLPQILKARKPLSKNALTRIKNAGL